MQEVRRELALPDDEGRADSGHLAAAAAVCGDTAAARRWVATRVAHTRAGNPVDRYWLAMVSAALHDDAAVFHWLDAAVKDHAGLIFMMRRDPPFQSYRDDPRFKAVMRRVYGT